MPASDYLLEAADVPPGATAPAANVANVKPLVDGKSYFGALHGLLTDLLIEPEPKQLPGGGVQRSFVFLSAWVLDPNLGLPDPRTSPQPDTLADLLVSLAEHDVDVWVILWLDPALVPEFWSPPSLIRWLITPIQGLLKPPPNQGEQPVQTEQVGLPQSNIVMQNLVAAIDLRRYKALANRVVLDYTAAPTGAHHMKVAVVYNAQQNTLDAFCGGMDPSPNRAGTIGHSEMFDGQHTGSPLDPVSYPVASPPAAPFLAEGGPGNIPAGSYKVRYVVYSVSEAGLKPALVSPWETIDVLSAASSIVVGGMDSLPASMGAVPLQICAVFARPAGTAELPRLAAYSDKPGTIMTLRSDPSLPTKELTLWEWHDTAVQVQGPAALPIAETLRDRWNDVIGGPTFTIDARAVSGLFWHGPVNEAPIERLAAPTVAAIPGTLPAGSYDVCAVVTGQSGGHTIWDVSDTTTITLSGTEGIQVSDFHVKDPLPAGETISAIDVYVKAGTGTKAMLAGTTNTPTQAVTILTDPSQWTGDLNAPFTPQLISDFSGIQPAPPATATQTVQMLRTFAQISGLTQHIGVAARPYSFVPKGEFTVYYGYRKAIAQAQQYVYIEDQCMYSCLLMDMLAQQVNKYPNLKVLLVTSDKGDPGDANADWENAHFWNSCIYESLVEKAPAQGNVKFFRSRGLTVHSKLVIIDDVWAAVGSANAINHSLAIDSEMQMSIYDGAGSFPKALRTTLWAEHLNISSSDAAYTDLADIGKALAMWWDPAASSIPQPHLYRAKEIVLPVKAPKFRLGRALEGVLSEATLPPKDDPLWQPF